MGLLLLSLGVLVAFFVAFLALERRGRPVVVVLTLLAVLLLDAIFYPDTEASSTASIFHPKLLGQNFRLTQLVIPLALVARVRVRGLPGRLDLSAPLWLAFFAWVAVSTATGILHGHAAPLVLRQASVLVHVGGAMAVAAGVPARDYVSGAAVPRFIQGCAVVATSLFLSDVSGLRLTLTVIPHLPLTDIGSYGADAATLFSSIGVLGLVLAVAHPRQLGGRAALLVPSLLLIVSHLASPQRAARLGLYVILLFLLLVACTPTARRRISLSLGKTLVASACLVAAVLAGVFTVAVTDAVTAPAATTATPVSDALEGLSARTRQGSVDSRFNQWAVARHEIAEHPLLGRGLGATLVHYEVGKKAFVESDINHNIVLDLLVRTGAVGSLLALASVLVVCIRAIRAWRAHVDDRVAALAIGAVALVGGLLAKGMVESIFEKHRIAVLLGVVLGLAISATMDHDEGHALTDEGSDERSAAGGRAPLPGDLTNQGSTLRGPDTWDRD